MAAFQSPSDSNDIPELISDPVNVPKHITLWNETNFPSPPTRIEVEYHPLITWSEFIQNISNVIKLKPKSFYVKVKSNGEKDFYHDDTSHLLQAGIIPTKKIWMRAYKIPPKDGEQEEEEVEEVEERPASRPASRQENDQPLMLTYTPSTNHMESSDTTYLPANKYPSPSTYTYSSTWGKSDSGFVGLSNQGATCYMNSLIQTLYMTPEFRHAIYQWDFKSFLAKKLEENKGTQDERDEAEIEKKCIPRQLQKLFLKLQLSESRSIQTKDLTKSFGWSSADAFTQHDVQELCRVLFDALETSFRGTDRANLVNELYQGTMRDYVQCNECKNESARTDHYLDLPLVIKGFGETKAVSSIEEALHKFVQAETLDGNNQYSCEKCNKKVDALKGLKIETLPYLLSLQLKRFDFDYMTMRRIKLNDRVTFPKYLNMDEFLKTPQAKDEDEVMTSKDEVDYDTLPIGENIYELYSVLIHRGTSMGGHYYALIKSFETDDWFEFNDSSVTRCSKDEYERGFGEGGYSSYQSSTNAYMLMYRKLDKKRNMSYPTKEDIPEELRKSLEDEEREAEFQKTQYKLKIIYDSIEKPLSVSQNITVEQLTELAAKEFGVEESYKQNRCRLRSYNTTSQSPEEPYEKPDAVLLQVPNIWSGKTVVLETKEKDQEFKKWSKDSITFKLYEFNLGLKKFNNPLDVTVDCEITLGELKKVLVEEYNINIPVEKQRIFKDSLSENSESKEVIGDEDTLKSQYKYTGYTQKPKAFIQEDTGSDPLEMLEEISRLKRLIEVKFTIETDSSNKEVKYALSFDKNISLREFKEQVKNLVGLEADEFKVSKSFYGRKEELKNDEKTLDDLNVTYTSLILEKGRPQKENEAMIKFYLYTLNPGAEEKEWTELFQDIINDTENVFELKKKLAIKLKEKDIAVEPENLRLRDKSKESPSIVFRNNTTVKDSSSYQYNDNEIAVQILSEPECIQDEDILATFIQWKPSTFTLDKKHEVCLKKTMKIPEVLEVLSKKFKIQNVSIAKSSDLHPLDMEKQNWKGRQTEISFTNDYFVSSIKDGDVLVFRDDDEMAKELAPEEQEQLEKERKLLKEQKVKSFSSYRVKEKALKIQV